MKKEKDTRNIRISDLKDTINTYIDLYNQTMEDLAIFLLRHHYFNSEYLDLKVKNKKENLSLDVTSCSYRDKRLNNQQIWNILSLHNKHSNLTNNLKLIEKIGSPEKFNIFIIELNDIQSNLIIDDKKTNTVRTRNLIKNMRVPYYPYIKDQATVLDCDNSIYITIKPASLFDKLQTTLQEYLNETIIFDKNGNLYDKFKGKEFETGFLKDINFDYTNISGIILKNNTDANIDMDKIDKDISNASFRGFNLNNYTLRSFNLTNTDLRETGATIDLASCNIALESKMSTGTLFDEENKFIFGNNFLSPEQVKTLGIKIYKKEQ